MTLQELLENELYAQVKAKLDETNAKETNKEKHVNFIDLSEGGYVTKDKYAQLETDLNGKVTELGKATDLIAELKKSTGKDEGLQEKINLYEGEIEKLKEENATLKTENALRFALAEAGALDVDYLMFKAKEKGEVKLGEDGKIKGEAELISGLKTQLPAQFKTEGKGGLEVLGDNRLPQGDTNRQTEPKSLEEALQQQYENNM